MKKLLIELLFSILLLGCSSPIKLINNNKLERIDIKDRRLVKAISEYANKNDLNNSVIIIVTKNIRKNSSIKYINKIYNLSNIYSQPISFYSHFNDDPVLIYSKKNGYINPKNYTEEFLTEVKDKLYNDWNLIEIKKGSYVFVDSMNMVLNHSIPWKFVRDKIDRERSRYFNRSKFLYGVSYFDYENYYNLDSLKIIK